MYAESGRRGRGDDVRRGQLSTRGTGWLGVRSVLTSSSLRYILASSFWREQHGIGRRGIGNFLKLRILAAKRLGHLHFRRFQDADELQSVDHGFALKMIVGDDKSFAGPLRDFADARNPGRELFRRVKIVVAFMRGDGFVGREPGVIPPALHPAA